PLQVPSFVEVKSAFAAAPTATPTVVRGPDSGSLTTPKHVRFFVVAADPRTFQGKRSPEPYLDSGGADWKPFLYKDSSSVGALVQNIVSEGDLSLTSDVSALDANLKEAIDKAWKERKIVILLVDGWTVDATTDSRLILAEFDRENYYNCSVLVP